VFRPLPVFHVTLEVAKVNTHDFFNDLEDKDIIRIFLPNHEQPSGDWIVAMPEEGESPAECIIGPEAGAIATFEE
jgi:hypothetical protein